MFDVVIIGGGPCGATAAEDLGKLGHKVALLDRPGRIKPCGGASGHILQAPVTEFCGSGHCLQSNSECIRHANTTTTKTK